MGKAFARPEALAEQVTHYCPGCTHGVIHRLVAEVIDELGARERPLEPEQGASFALVRDRATAW